MRLPPLVPSSLLFSSLCIGLPIVAAACKDAGKVSADHATTHALALVALSDKDVGELERGLPEGAKKLGALYENGEPPKDTALVRRELLRQRRDVPDLLVAKNTFSALTDANGIAIRNDLEQDAMAGQNVLTLFPALSAATTATKPTSATGSFPRPSSPTPDKDWLLAMPIARDGKTVGLYIAGWTFRSFARHLAETLKHDMQAKLLADKDTGKMPIVYVGVFDKSGVYTAPTTPPTNEKALTDLDLVSKTATGPASGTTQLTDRAFGWSAMRMPRLGPDIGVAVLRSEI